MSTYLPKDISLDELSCNSMFEQYFILNIEAFNGLSTIKSLLFKDLQFIFSQKDLKSLQFMPSIDLKGGAFLMLFNNGLNIVFRNGSITIQNSYCDSIALIDAISVN